jgi:hypothetical protein
VIEDLLYNAQSAGLRLTRTSLPLLGADDQDIGDNLQDAVSAGNEDVDLFLYTLPKPQESELGYWGLLTNRSGLLSHWRYSSPGAISPRGNMAADQTRTGQ